MTSIIEIHKKTNLNTDTSDKLHRFETAIQKQHFEFEFREPQTKIPARQKWN